MAVPKRKKSKMRVRQRRATIKAAVNETAICSGCGEVRRIHHACPKCGKSDFSKPVAEVAE